MVVRAVVDDDTHITRAQHAVRRRRRLHLDLEGVPALGGGEVLLTGEDQPHRSPGLHRQRAGHCLVLADLGLGAEPSTDRDLVHHHLLDLQVEDVGDLLAHDEGRLGARPQLEDLPRGIPARDHAVRLHGGVGLAAEGVGALDAGGWLASLDRPTPVPLTANGDVPAGVDAWRISAHGLRQPGGRRQWLVVHRDEVECGVCRGEGLGGHSRHLLPDEPHHVEREDATVGERSAVVDVLPVGEVSRGDHRHDRGAAQRRRHVDPADQRVRLLTAEDPGVQHAGQGHVSGVDGLAGGLGHPVEIENPRAE